MMKKCSLKKNVLSLIIGSKIVFRLRDYIMLDSQYAFGFLNVGFF